MEEDLGVCLFVFIWLEMEVEMSSTEKLQGMRREKRGHFNECGFELCM